MEMKVDSGLLQKTAEFVQHAAPMIEKTAAEKAAYDAKAPELVDQMIHAGVIKAETRSQAIADLQNGGLDKAAQVILWLADQVQPAAIGQPSVEKKAGYHEAKPGQRASDAAFERILGI